MRVPVLPAGSGRGFTLLEVIVTLMVASILGVIFVQFMGTRLTGSIQPLVYVQNNCTATQVMENMTADFNRLTATDAAFLTTFKSHVQNGSTIGSNPYFGPYTLEGNSFVTFDADGHETAGGDRVLKVSISVGSQRLTALFTK